MRCQTTYVRKEFARASRNPFRGRWEFTFLRLAGWAILLVVLFSATPMGEQIRLRPVGSAFDPATAAVAVSPKKKKNIERDQLVSSEPGDDSGGPDFLRFLASLPPGGFPRTAAYQEQQTHAEFNTFGAPGKPLARSQAARAPPKA
jgi:hypothetical protein